MAQINVPLYVDIAEAYAAIDVSLSTVNSNARTALDAIVDVTTTNYPDPSVNADAALEIELALLTSFNTAYVSSTSIAGSVSALLDAVRAVNNFVINQSGGTATAKVKLDTYVNSISSHGSWSAGAVVVPGGWKNLSSDAGYNVTDWT